MVGHLYNDKIAHKKQQQRKNPPEYKRQRKVN